jgi:hypothetical protein
MMNQHNSVKIYSVCSKKLQLKANAIISQYQSITLLKFQLLSQTYQSLSHFCLHMTMDKADFDIPTDKIRNNVPCKMNYCLMCNPHDFRGLKFSPRLKLDWIKLRQAKAMTRSNQCQTPGSWNTNLRARAHQGNWQPQRNHNFQELLSA